jgi:hypothetical protein
MKKIVFIAAAVPLLAAVAPAGELKTHSWPQTTPEYIPQKVCDVKVIMDVGYWIECVNQEEKLKLVQKSIHTYENCMTVEMKSNFRAQLSCDIASTGAIPGTYTCNLDPTVVDVGASYVSLCVKLEDADLGGTAGGSQDVHVATVTIKVVPAP